MWKEKLQQIASDNVHGATYLTKELLELLCSLEGQVLQEALKEARRIQPMMASIYNLVRSFKGEKEVCKRWWKEFEAANERVVQKAAVMMEGKAVMTHSFSSLVYEAILLARPKKVICTISAPKNEGADLAQKLCEAGIESELIVDAAMGLKVKEVDAIFIGADGVGSFGVVHKVGTLPLALLAKEFQKPLYSLAPRQKFWPKEFPTPTEPQREPSEVAQGCFGVDNRYFDITPLELVRLITN